MSDATLSANREAQGTWQPIESAPKDGTRILAYCLVPNRGNGYVEIVRWANWGITQEWHWHRTRSIAADQPTHWMPLPEPPIPATPVSGA